MGEVLALDSTEDEQTIDENQTGELEIETEEATATEVETDGEDSQETEVEEFEIVSTVDDGSQPKDSNSGIRKRINKLNSKVEEAQEEASNVSSELAIARQKNELLQLALDQQKAKPEAVMPPNPLDFDDGAGDPKYVAALNGYNQQFIQAEIAKHTAQQPAAPTRDVELEKRQVAHYERAAKLGMNDFDETEDKVIDILGKDIVNQFIKASDHSQTVLYHLGKNPDKAEQIGQLIKSNPIKGVLKLGALGAELKVQKKARKPAPNPDKELAGAHPGARRKGGKGPTFE